MKDINQLRKTEREVAQGGKPEALTGEYRRKTGERVWTINELIRILLLPFIALMFSLVKYYL